MNTYPNIALNADGVVTIPLPGVPASAEVCGVDGDKVYFADGDRELRFEIPLCDRGRATIFRHRLTLSDGTMVDADLLVPQSDGDHVMAVEVVQEGPVFFVVARPLKGEAAARHFGEVA